jgi:LEA14-like dessication related protein
MRWSWFRAGVSAALVLTVAACGSSVFQQPIVTLESVQLAGLGLRGGTLMVNVDIENPNRFALSANQIRYQLAIADTDSARDTVWMDLASGTYAEQLSVGGGETAHVAVPVEFTYSGLGSAAASLLRAGTFNYRATGAVDVRTPVGAFEVPFRRVGIVTLLSAR